MIKDNIRNYKSYTAISENFKKAFTYLAKEDFSQFKEDKIYLDGEKLYVMHQLYETESITGKLYESHKRYADIQFILEGEEVICVSDRENLILETEYNEAKDCCFYKCEKGTDLTLHKGDFAVFFPQDAHMPKLMSQNSSMVKKIVFKVEI